MHSIYRFKTRAQYVIKSERTKQFFTNYLIIKAQLIIIFNEYIILLKSDYQLPLKMPRKYNKQSAPCAYSPQQLCSYKMQINSLIRISAIKQRLFVLFIFTPID